MVVVPMHATANTRAEWVLGARMYTDHCALCHDNSMHMLNDTGPALFGVVNRKVGSLSEYTYSPVMQAARDRGDVWTNKRLDEFLTSPEAMYPGTGMPMNFGDPKTRKAIITYLRSLKEK
jgi:cytochrome c